MVTFRIFSSISCAESMFFMCFEVTAVTRRNGLDLRDLGYTSALYGIGICDKSRGGAILLNVRLIRSHSYCGSRKLAFSNASILSRVRLVPIFTGETKGIGGLSCVQENRSIHFRRVPFTHLSISSAQKKN